MNDYAKAGVDVEAGYQSTKIIKEYVEKTNNKGVFSQLGGFAAIFDFQKYNFKDPLLVSSSDGVGTKLEIAKEMHKFDTIGIDLVAMCVNDLLCLGAKPIYFLDYIAVEKNNPQMIGELVKGMSNGLQQCDTALIGGETAEMPGVYHEGGFDLAGFVVGLVERDEIIDNSQVKPGQVIIGLASSGLHSNGYSLVRKIINGKNLELDKIYEGFEKTLGEVLLEPTKIYVKEILNLIDKVKVKGIVNITGGGFYENVKRVTGEYGACFNSKKIPVLPIFDFLAKHGQLKDMYGYFNMGIGMMVIVDQNDVNDALALLDDAYIIGEVTSASEIKIC